MNRKYLLSIIILLFSLTVKSQTEKLLKHWWFYKTDIGSPWEAFRPEKLSKLPKFKQVEVPHTYNAYDAVDPEGPYYQGPAWYYTFVCYT